MFGWFLMRIVRAFSLVHQNFEAVTIVTSPWQVVCFIWSLKWPDHGNDFVFSGMKSNQPRWKCCILCNTFVASPWKRICFLWLQKWPFQAKGLNACINFEKSVFGGRAVPWVCTAWRVKSLYGLFFIFGFCLNFFIVVKSTKNSNFNNFAILLKTRAWKPMQNQRYSSRRLEKI